MRRSANRRFGNPFMREAVMQNASFPLDKAGHQTMTINGTINKTLILLLIMMVTTYMSYLTPSNIFLYVGAIGGIIAVIVASVKTSLSPFVAPIYALLEGLFVGTITAKYALFQGGIVFHAVTLTISILLLMLIIYRLKIIPINRKVIMGVIIATGSIFLIYLFSWIMSFFGVQLPLIHQGGTIGIVFSLVIIGIAAFNLLIDFEFIVRGSEQGAPKYMEWFAGMGLLITLVWLYIEILRLLSILNRE